MAKGVKPTLAGAPDLRGMFWRIEVTPNHRGLITCHHSNPVVQGSYL
jgi:hypothetical protein